MDTAQGGLEAVAVLGNLCEPVRRRLYEYVAARGEPVARDEAAAAAGISRTLAAYHLDKLADAGILAVSYARLSERSGPGGGRPAKRYTRRQREVLASVPPRNYALLAELLGEAVANDTSGTARSAVAGAARKAGRASVSDKSVLEALWTCGFEPAQRADGAIELRNCPFRQLAHKYPELVCGLNLEMVRGMLEAAGDRPAWAELAPHETGCCVVVRANMGFIPVTHHGNQ
ncbi:MAG: helix-turn-helix domain-containing protein [Mycobacterium sp.]|nr:helix-turn-helix domain-containing protein [Mycobacterium sp.]